MSAEPKEISKPITSSENQQSGYRKIAFSVESGERQFFLKIPDTRHTWNFIPLGTVPSATKGAHPKAANITVPVIPLCFTTPDCDPQKAALPRPGWLYVFRDGKLWREYAVTNTGYYSDLNLKENQKKEIRQATGTFDSRVQLPYKEAGQTQTIEMAFSEVQWSWARINKLQSDAELRRQRMQQIDLSGYGANFPTLPANGNKARVENIKNAPPIYHLGLQRESNIPVAYLHDPLGVARDLAGKYQAAWDQMDKLLADLANPNHQGVKAKEYPFAKWFDSAVLANQYFFAKVPDIEPEGQIPPAGKDKEQWVRAKVQREQWKKKLSKADIDTALGVEKRQTIRQQIKTCKQELLSYLDSPHNEIQQALGQALDDYFTRPAPKKAPWLADNTAHYGDAWRMVERLIAKLGDHEYSLDAGLETEPPNLQQLTQNDPGGTFLLKLADPQQGYFLQSRLFPQPASGNNPLKPKVSASSESGPVFRSQHIHTTFQYDPEIFSDFFSHFFRAAGLAETDQARNSLLRLINAALGLDLYEREITLTEYQEGQFANGDVMLRMFALQEQFKGKAPGRESSSDLEQLPSQNETDTADTFQVNRRGTLAAGGGLEHLNDAAKNIEKQTVDTNTSVLGRSGANWQGANPTLEGTNGSYHAQVHIQGRSPVSPADAVHYDNTAQIQVPGGGQGTVQVYGHDGKLLGATTVNAFKQGKAFSRRQWRTKVHQTRWEEVKIRIVINRQAEGLPALAKKLHDHGVWTRGVLPILAGVEVWNLGVVSKAVIEKRNTEEAGRAWVDFWGAVMDTLAISGVVTQARVEHVAKRQTGLAVDKILENGGPLADKIRFSRITARGLGSAAGLYSMGLALNDMIDNIHKGDDAAVAHGMMAGGFALTTIAEVSGLLVAGGWAGNTSLAGSIAGGPWLWLGLGTVLAGAALLTWVMTEDSPLEEWLANGPFSVSQPAQLYEQELPGQGRRKYWREQNGTRLIFKEGDVLEKILYPSGGRFVEKGDGSVFLKGESGETLVGKIGQPFTAWDKLMARTGRFAGHTPGTKATDKFGRWFETPRSASLALADAIYRPRLGLQITQNHAFKAAEITVQIPNFIEDKTKLFVELWKNGAVSHQGIETFTGMGSGPRTVRVVWPILESGNTKVLAKVRMDLYGNGDFLLPAAERSEGAWIEAEAVFAGIDTRRIHSGEPFRL